MASAAEIMAPPAHLFFDKRLTVLRGPAGSGKTFTLREIGKGAGSTLFLAPTHYLKRSSAKAFKNVQTVAWAALAAKRHFARYRTVMITEAAMMRDLEITAILLKLSVGTHLYLDCDPFQIPAITDGGTKDILGSASFMQLLEKPSTRCFFLKEQYRTRNKMVIDVINAIQFQRHGELLDALLRLISTSLVDPRTVPYNGEDIVVAHTHAIRNYVWSTMCTNLELETEGETDLVVGHQVRLRVTKKVPPKFGRKQAVVYANGDMCELLAVAPKFVKIQLENGAVHKVPHMADGTPAVLQTGCFTAYSVQGLTAPRHVYVVCDAPSIPPPICISTLYVMLTRAQSQNCDGAPELLHFVVHDWPRFCQALSKKIMSAPFTAFQQELHLRLQKITI